jgi:hypothetical protein
VAAVADVGAPAPAESVIVTVEVVELCAELLSLATTVMTFTPEVSVSARLQFAVPEPDAVSLLARTPFTVTDEIPLSPLPLSLAVPEIVIELFVTVCVWVAIVNWGGVVSVDPPPVPPVMAVRKFATRLRV